MEQQEEPRRRRRLTIATTLGMRSPKESRFGSGLTGPVRLVVVEGDHMDRAVEIVDKPVVVGADPSCDLVIDDPRVSGRHCRLERNDGRIVLQDLKSTNGTIFQGAAVSEAVLPLGATFRVGRTYLRLLREHQALHVPPSQSQRFGDLVGASLAMREVFAVLELAAESDVTVLIEGETGTGKELAARAIHEGSARRREPFVAIDCGALPETLLESELFGHVKGAFTGAAADRSGAFLRADGGTLFLDELGTVPLSVQARLLRAIEERAIRPVGADKERSVDVRLVAAASRDLEAMVDQGDMRPDLFYRLAVLRVKLPPLRARREDIGPIVGEMMRQRGLPPGEISGQNLDRLASHRWPGNVRELRNVIDRAIALTPGCKTFQELRLAVVPDPAPERGLKVRVDLPFRDAKTAVVDAFERAYLRDLYERCDGNISQAAREADLDRKHLRTLLKKHDLV